MAGSVAGPLPGQTSLGGRDAFVRKYDATGAEVWTRQFGSTIPGIETPSDVATGVAVDSTGIYVTGYVGGSLPGQTTVGDFDAFVRKYNLNGVELWTQQFGTSAVEFARSISVDGTALYVGGETLGAFPGQTASGSRDAFISKFDTSGNPLWTRQFGSPLWEDVASVAADATAVYVAGRVVGSTSGTPAFVRKYDANGTELWTRRRVAYSAPSQSMPRHYTSAVRLIRMQHSGSTTWTAT